MANLSQEKRQRMLAFLNTIREEHKDDDDVLIALGEIENELNSKKYGLVWERHEEAVDVQMRDNIPVFTECVDKEITTTTGGVNFLLEGDNLHSLRLLEKTHAGKIDVIYIDPPYNTGNKDFVYDDAFVDSLDGYRHSKWLSFMYERLLMARKLLSKNGVIAISIGYHEIHNLMIMCQELFDGKQVVAVTVQTSGGKPNGSFNISHEYVVFIAPNDFKPNPSEDAMNTYSSPYHGMNLATFNQTQRPNQAYPIFINQTGCIVGCGKSLQERIDDGTYSGELQNFVFDYDEAPEGTVAIWPVTAKGEPCVWRLISSRLLSDWKEGYIKVVSQNSKTNKNRFAVQYLSAGIIKKIKSGELESYKISDSPDIPTIDVKSYKTAGVEISTIWTDKRFYTTKGSNEIRDILGVKKFSYPKPLDLISYILSRITTPTSAILDFFAGSGTTGHAVLKLNAEDGGNRRFILCTNNENNICEEVTYERIKRVIEGYGDTEGIPTNLKYYRTDFVSKDSDSLTDELLEHIKEMIQLEHGIKLDGNQYFMVLTDEEADKLEQEWDKYKDVKALYVSRNVLFTTEQNMLFNNVDIHIIPDDYFKFELQEVGEAW